MEGRLICCHWEYIRGGGGSRNGLDNYKWMAWDIITHDFGLEILKDSFRWAPNYCTNQWFSVWGDTAPRRWVAMSREAVLCVTVQGGGIWWIEAKDVAKHPTAQGTFPMSELSVLKCPQCRGWEEQTQAARNRSLEKVSATCNKHVKLLHMENTNQGSLIHSFNRLCVSAAHQALFQVLRIQPWVKQERSLPNMEGHINDRYSVRQFQLLRIPGFSLMLCAPRHCGHTWACHVGSQHQKQQEREITRTGSLPQARPQQGMMSECHVKAGCQISVSLWHKLSGFLLRWSNTPDRGHQATKGICHSQTHLHLLPNTTRPRLQALRRKGNLLVLSALTLSLVQRTHSKIYVSNACRLPQSHHRLWPPWGVKRWPSQLLRLHLYPKVLCLALINATKLRNQRLLLMQSPPRV